MKSVLERGWKMEEITVNKDELIKRLEENLDKHKKEYQEAVEDYTIAALKAMESKAEDLKSGRPIELDFYDRVAGCDIRPPEDHTKDYEVALDMLQWHNEPTITIAIDKFQCFVRDDWQWKKNFAVMSANYKMWRK